MTRFKLPGGKPNMAVGFSKSEKRRLLLLSLAAVLVAGAMGYELLLPSGSSESTQGAGLPLDAARESGEMHESVALPTIDRASLDAAVSDETRADRVILERAPLDELAEIARRLTQRHFELFGGEILTKASVENLIEAPSEHRGEAFIARGWIEDFSQRRTPQGDSEWLGTLIHEDDSVSYFVTYEVPDGASMGSFVRVDGLFLKVFSDESEEEVGTWVDGPLLVAPRVERSYPEGLEVTDLDFNVLAQLEDDQFFTADGKPATWQGIPFDPLWHMMSYVRANSPASEEGESHIDWENDALELNVETLERVMDNGAAFRGVPFKIPISRLQACRVVQAGENPSRIDRYSMGWIGNVSWKAVIHFYSPTELGDLRIRDYVTGRGYFLKNFAYASDSKGLRLAPVFVLESVDKFTPLEQPIFDRFAYAIAITSGLIVLTITLLLIRDRRQAKALQEDLVRRRRARRDRRGASSPSDSPGSMA